LVHCSQGYRLLVNVFGVCNTTLGLTWFELLWCILFPRVASYESFVVKFQTQQCWEYATMEEYRTTTHSHRHNCRLASAHVMVGLALGFDEARALGLMKLEHLV
jgi:hypothetical protein